MMDLIGAVGSVASGGILGLVGSLIGTGLKIYQDGKQKTHDLEMTKITFSQEIELQKMQLAAREAETERELAVAAEEGSWRGLQSSYMSDTEGARHASQWVNDLRSLFRPFLTLVLSLLVGVIYFTIADEGTKQDTVQAVLFTWQAAVTWWFGDRVMGAARSRSKDGR